MVKLRMTTADVAAEVRCLRKLIGMRCANIYDISPKTYVIKLARSSGVTESGESEKALVLLESGVRLHTTEFARDKSTTPSGFTLKLRKHLRTRRLEDVRQLGIDRIVDFQFGLGENAHHIILELYAQGNLLLTDSDYNILQLLRTWKDEEKGLSIAAHQRYPVESCRLLQRTTVEKLDTLFRELKLSKSLERSEISVTGNEGHDVKKVKTKWGKEGDGKGPKGSTASLDAPGAAKKRASGGPTLKVVLGAGLGYGPVMIEHIILDAGLQPDAKIAGEDSPQKITEEDFNALVVSVKRFEDWLEAVVGGELTPEGYIFMQKPAVGKKHSSSADVQPESDIPQIYDEFYPLVLKQLEIRKRVKFETFDDALDEFFSKVEGQRSEQQRKAQEDTALSKLEKIRADQTNRVKALMKEVDQSVRMAELIEYNLDDVDAGILAVRNALARGMDWKDLGRMIKEEKKAGNPVAGLIHSLQLETNQITLLLSNNLDDMDEEEKTRPVDKVLVDLSLSAHANARSWFEAKKRHATKQEKTEAAHEKALKAAEKRTQQQLAQAKTVAAITHIRKVHWFEKFNWFISSENFLVISGRDAQQNELLVKRYMKKGDLYVHADLHGASSTIIKNHDPYHPIPPLTINQAGCFTVCRSQAWDSKIVTSAWWVEAHQVSKAAPTGEYLTVGSFMVRGKKNFLPPNPLVMGYGFLFRLDDTSLASHLNERCIRAEDEGEADSEVSSVVNAGGAERDEVLDSQVQMEDGDSDLDIQDQEMDVDVSKTSSSPKEVAGESELPELNRDTNVSEEGEDAINSMAETPDLDELLDRALQLRSIPKSVKQNNSKYGLEDKTMDDVESYDRISNQLGVSKGVQRDKPYVSKAERRKLKKLGKNTADKFESDNAREESTFIGDALEEQAGSDVKSQEAAGKLYKMAEVPASKPCRGKRGKLKKIKGKYVEQDEERQHGMVLLASAGQEDLKRADGISNDIKSDTSMATEKTELKVAELESKVCYKCKKTGHISRDCPNNLVDMNVVKNEDGIGTMTTGLVQDVSDSKETSPSRIDPGTSKVTHKTEGLNRRAYARAAKEEIAAIMAEENVVELGEDEKEKLTELDSLTGKPVLSDVLLYAVPVCGPYNALQGYKYRVKLTPGTAKRGKGAKVAVDVFTHMPDVSAREKELMKAVTDPELVACMIGNSKVTAPGLSKLKQLKKKSKKVSDSRI